MKIKLKLTSNFIKYIKKNILTIIKKLIKNEESKNFKEKKLFFEMIVIPLKKKINELKNVDFNNFLNFKHIEFLIVLKNQIKMVIEELKSFLEIFQDYHFFIGLYLKQFKLKKYHSKIYHQFLQDHTFLYKNQKFTENENSSLNLQIKTNDFRKNNNPQTKENNHQTNKEKDNEIKEFNDIQKQEEIDNQIEKKEDDEINQKKNNQKKQEEIDNQIEEKDYQIDEEIDNQIKQEKDYEIEEEEIINDINENEIVVKELSYKLYKSDILLIRYEDLLSLLSLIILKQEIPEMKKRKKKRYFKILNIFSHQELTLLNQELLFWESVKKITD